MMYLLRSLLSACMVISTAWASDDDSEWIVGQQVETSSGNVIGHSSCWKPLVSEYLGIRYAKPPVGELRFAEPEPYRSDETYEAASMMNSCPSRYWRNTNLTVSYNTTGEAVVEQIAGYGETFDEDCLGLSIWTRPEAGEKRKAVLMFIYGGSFYSGSQSHPGYNGALLANDHDVVVVTFNYRLTILGFPGSDILQPNLGMLDVRLAVEWVRDNIEKFGGDPSRITLFGQSAGAKAVDAYTYGWPEDPIVNGVILQSGNVPPWTALTTREQAIDQWYEAVKTLGCDGDPVATVECVRSKEWREVVDLENLPEFRFEPTPDEWTIYEDPFSQLMAGNFSHVPLLVGHTDHETGFYEYIGADGSRAEDLTCASRIIAGSRTMVGLPAWHYTYAGTWPNQDIGTGGAYHTSDIGMVFGTHEIITHRPGLCAEWKLSWAMSNAWASFARDPYGALGALGWPEFDISDSAPTNIVLGGERSSSIYFEYYNHWIENCHGEKRPF